MEEDAIFGVELDLLNSNMKREVCNVLNVFLYFLKKFDERKAHNVYIDIKFKI